MVIEEIKNKYSDMTRERIKLIQEGLTNAGYNPGTIDGYIGKNRISI